MYNDVCNVLLLKYISLINEFVDPIVCDRHKSIYKNKFHIKFVYKITSTNQKFIILLSLLIPTSCKQFFFYKYQLCSDVNKTATSSSHQDSEYDTASDSQSSDEADLLRKREPISHSSNLPIPFSKKNTFYFVFCSLKSICFLSILKHIMTMVAVRI